MSFFSVEITFLLYCLGADVVLACLVEYKSISFWVYTLQGYTVVCCSSGHLSIRNLHIVWNIPLQYPLSKYLDFTIFGI